MFNIQKGTKDILPKDSYKWQKVRENAYKISQKYNLYEISTPTFESTDLFSNVNNDFFDESNNEMYTFEDKGKRSISLKPESVTGIVRSYVENGFFNDTLPAKLFYISPCFRYEKPQAGRLRESHQFGSVIIGSNSISSDIEIILIAHDFFKLFGVNPKLNINYLGCEHCKENYIKKLKEFVKPNLDNMCDDCNKRFSSNLTRIIDCKNSKCEEILKQAPKITDCLCSKCRDKFEEFKKMLTSCGIEFSVQDNLIKDFDIYSDFVFEFVDEDKVYGKNALCSGGRYYDIVKKLGGKSTPVTGFAIGIERLLMFLEKNNIVLDNKKSVQIYVANNTDNDNYIIKFVKSLRDKGFFVESNLMSRSLKSQFKFADKINAEFVLTIGDDEINENKVSIKNMKTGEQIKIWSNDVEEYLKKNV